jgi:hypothetical protein
VEQKELKLIKSAIIDINSALSCIDALKEGLGLRGQSFTEDNLEAAKTKLKRIILESTGEL